MQRNAKHSIRLARAAARGVTLIEVLIVVAILSLIAASVTVAVFPRFREVQIATAGSNAHEIRNAVNRWRGMRGGDACPTVSQLLADKEIDSASKTRDPWDSPYKIQCVDDETIVSSLGPDKREGSEDDIVVPPKRSES